MTEFPEGAGIDGRWTITETLRGGPDRGMFRATGAGRALVTMGPPQREAHDALRLALALAVPGVAPLLAITTVVGEGAPYDVLVEGEPDGAPVTVRRPEDSCDVEEAHAYLLAQPHGARDAHEPRKFMITEDDGALADARAARERDRAVPDGRHSDRGRARADRCLVPEVARRGSAALRHVTSRPLWAAGPG